MKKKQVKTGKMPKTKMIFLQEPHSQKEIIPVEKKRDILKARAQALALKKKDEPAKQDLIEIVEFSLAFEKYGIETDYVREVYPLKDYTVLPGLPNFVLGIINVRGQIISVIDLKKFFNLPEKGLGELNKVIIIKNERMKFGILADIIHGTRLVPFDTIRASLLNISDIGSEYLKGITKEHLIILDTKKILEDEKIIIA
jgi:purine-binding chemotaxis protein CheW